jgi:hypothetical protein
LHSSAIGGRTDNVEILQTLVSALVVAGVGLILARLGNQRFGALEGSLTRVEDRIDGRIDALDAKFDAKIDALDAKFDAKIDALDAKLDAKIGALDAKFDVKVDSLRADITQIALAVGARPARGTG